MRVLRAIEVLSILAALAVGTVRSDEGDPSGRPAGPEHGYRISAGVQYAAWGRHTEQTITGTAAVKWGF